MIGIIGKLTLQMPWNKLGSKPVVAEVEDVSLFLKTLYFSGLLALQVHLVLTPVTEYAYTEEEQRERDLARKLQQLSALDEQSSSGE